MISFCRSLQLLDEWNSSLSDAFVFSDSSGSLVFLVSKKSSEKSQESNNVSRVETTRVSSPSCNAFQNQQCLVAWLLGGETLAFHERLQNPELFDVV